MADSKRQADEVEEPDAKKAKTKDDTEESVTEVDPNLKLFIPEKILNVNSARKSVNVVGKLRGKSGIALVILEKTPIRDEHVERTEFFSDETIWDVIFENDIYSIARSPHTRVGSVKATLTYPAGEHHVKRYTHTNCHMVTETPELYKEVSLPAVQKEQLNLQWVFNILEGKREKERIILDDPDEEVGFVIVPDLKWDGTTPETLYLLAIARKKGIRCLRDLDGSYLPLLKNIRDKGKKAISEKYNLADTRLRIYLHYHPSFYHLHVHFSYLQFDAPGIHVERAHLLDTVIYNIENNPEYYKMANLSFLVRENDTLFKAFETAGYVAKTKPVNNVSTELIVK